MTTPNPTGINPFEDPIDRIFAEIAFSIQLPPSLHAKAVKRYEAVRNFLSAETCAFKDQIEHFYPQGSMAIDATISSRGTDDEYDIDIVAQLGTAFRGKSPLYVLTELGKALASYPVEKVTRQTRCVTLQYNDHMHIDITPSIRDDYTPDRQSRIMHAKGPTTSALDKLVEMNAYGFNEWYKSKTPEEQQVMEAFRNRWLEMNRLEKADAEVDDVPDQTQFVVKNTATLALQILKRHRNIMYADLDERMPPSVMLSRYAAVAAQPNSSLTDMILRIARWIVADIRSATALGKQLHIENPVYSADVFTDRWPETLVQQNRYANFLLRFIDGIEKAKRKAFNPIELQDWLRSMFGQRVVTRSIDSLATTVGSAVKAATPAYSRTGRLLLPTAGLALTQPSLVRAAPHTFMGDWPK
ncbi:hypothetical protein ABAC460_02775 [Asticcacaulis sp. AC460]|uniref:nucleotidyltransferase domain-containing protein n=1 Tax=Asticcacaulis sp. AC460 TaxID=1282360 RepID=UPI0003C3E24B|nr:nucleotidyltransferase [Asticcacaulis sp. AC460]ESQ92774.1 hypothetical protein ABAC460_02775 [Asticcacaulis sp. AC460]